MQVIAVHKLLVPDKYATRHKHSPSPQKAHLLDIPAAAVHKITG